MISRTLALTAALAVCACSKKPDTGATAPQGSASAGSAEVGSAKAEATKTAAPAGKPAPAVTAEYFLGEPPKWTIEAMDRGLWTSDNGGPFTQSCRVALGTTMVRVGKIRDEAKAKPDGVKCEARGAYTVCTFEDKASWIFVADDDSDETILMAVVIGTADWSKVEPQLPPKTACPRPSQD